MDGRSRIRAGAALGRYELLAPVARGGMAEVWAARLEGTRGFQKLVAIKTILPALSDDPRFERMFLDEAALASRIRHPHVVEILDLGEERDVLYLVMEWIDGETLATLLRKGAAPVPAGIASRLVMQACAGLHAAHELRDDEGRLLDLVHRDVSPQNLLVTREGVLKIVDFGIAKALGRIAGETAVGNVKGKIPYMAPEQALAQPTDRRSDIFALGSVYYFLVTGQHPFRGEDEGETIRNVVAASPRRPREIETSVPAEIDEVIMAALARQPAGRFPTMAAFETAIAKALAKLGMVVNDQSVKEYMRETLGDRSEERERLLGAIRRADQRPATSATPTSEPTSVTADATEDSSVSVGSDVGPSGARTRRRGARVALLSLSLALGAVVVAVWFGGSPTPASTTETSPGPALVEAAAPEAQETVPSATSPTPVVSAEPTAEPQASASVFRPPVAPPRPPRARAPSFAGPPTPSAAPTAQPTAPPAPVATPAPTPSLPGHPL